MSVSHAGGALSTEESKAVTKRGSASGDAPPGERVTTDEHAADPVVRRFPYLYAYLITGFTFLFIFIAILGPSFLPREVPERSWRVIDTVLGFLLGVGLSAILQFFYGSSQGSRSKDEQLTTLAQSRHGSLGLSAPAGSEREMFADSAGPRRPASAVSTGPQRQTSADAVQANVLQENTFHSDMGARAAQTDAMQSAIRQPTAVPAEGGAEDEPRS